MDHGLLLTFCIPLPSHFINSTILSILATHIEYSIMYWRFYFNYQISFLKLKEKSLLCSHSFLLFTFPSVLRIFLLYLCLHFLSFSCAVSVPATISLSFT